MKRIVIMAILFAAILLGGCNRMNILPQSDESVRDEILKNLNEKYGVTFTAISLERAYHDTLHCYVSGGDPDADYVRAERSEVNYEYVYKDTYFGRVIRDEVETEVKSLCSGLDVPLQVFYSSDSFYFDSVFDRTKTYADLKSWIASGNGWRFTIAIVLPLDDICPADDYANLIFDKITESGFRGLVHVYSLPTVAFEKTTRTNLNNLIIEYEDTETVHSKSIN